LPSVHLTPTPSPHLHLTLQVADNDGHRNSSMLSMNWVAVDINPANEDHRLSKPEYVHVWISPGRWFNMPQAAISLEEDGANIVSSSLADELLGYPFAHMALRDSGAHVGR